MLPAAAGIVSAAVWVYLRAARGGFWRMRDRAHECPEPAAAPRIAAVIPGRNEAATIALAVRSLARQDYAGELFLFVVDDHSSDATASIARQAADETSSPERIAILQ